MSTSWKRAMVVCSRSVPIGVAFATGMHCVTSTQSQGKGFHETIESFFEICTGLNFRENGNSSSACINDRIRSFIEIESKLRETFTFVFC